jgi:hypothetical protein
VLLALKNGRGFPDQRLVELWVVRRQDLGIGRKGAFDALWGIGGTGGGSRQVVQLRPGLRGVDSDELSPGSAKDLPARIPQGYIGLRRN